MNAMIDPSLLNKYLAGDATDIETQQCEAFLNDPANRDQCNPSDLESKPQDSLVETLRNLGDQTIELDLENSDSEKLVEQIQSLVPAMEIDSSLMNRVLNPAQSEDELGRIGHYRVLEFIASGGMGLVFKAEDPQLERMVCIKVLNPMLGSNAQSKSRFARESRAAAQLRNDRIVTVLDVGEHRELPYFVMQLLDGCSLREKLNAEAPLGRAAALRITRQIAEGLSYAHGLGYLHRDIKPENIWITTEGDIKLLDFGLARSIDETTNLTNTGAILGTPSYMSPEQVQGKELDVRSDLFSVGSVLFEMLTGDSPFGKSNLFSTMMSVANDTPGFPNASAANAVPADLVPIVQSLLEKTPDGRLASAEALIRRLDLLEQGQPLPSNSGGSRVGGRWSLIASGLAGAGLVLLILALFWMNDKGTLVVEADPSVNVQIADEAVSIHDPQTGKQFKATIGDHPLRSGVYQLELVDESGEYVLSSDVIAIRRGEKQIVRIELRPPETDRTAGNAEGKNVADTGSSPSIPAESRPTLAELPTLDARQLERKLNLQKNQALFPDTIVTQPSPRKGVTTWTIDRTINWSNQFLPNADGSLYATTNRTENIVRIWNSEHQPQLLIPAQDTVEQVAWSPEPNILAVIENGNHRKQITVWKIFDSHVEALDVIPTDAEQIGWSWDGLSLALQSEEVSFIDLGRGSVFAHPNFGIRGQVSYRPWSLDGRFFATSNEQTVKVWDLQNQKLYHVFANAEECRFLPERHHIAIRRKSNWEIWDLDSFERQRVVIPEPNWISVWPDPKFEHLVAVSEDAKFIAKNIRTGEVTDVSLNFPNTISRHADDESLQKRWFRRGKLNWSANGTSYIGIFADVMMVPAKTPTKPTLRSIVDHVFKATPRSSYVPIGSGHRTESLDVSQSNRMVYFNDVHERANPISGFDFGTLKRLPRTEGAYVDTGLIYRISPDGKLVAVVGSNQSLSNSKQSAEKQQELAKRWSADLAKAKVYSVDTGRLQSVFENGSMILDIQWSPDSKKLIVSSVEKVSEPMSKQAKRQQYRASVDRMIERYDADGDGLLSLHETEGTRYFPKSSVDKNNDQLWSADELIDAFAAKSNARQSTPSMDSCSQLAIKLVDIVKNKTTRLQPGEKDENGSFRYCFQRSPSRRIGNWYFAKPVIRKNQLAIPLFDPLTFRNGARVRRKTESAPYQDRLGLFNLDTGQLVESSLLNETFEGNRLAISDDIIMIGRRNDERRSTIDSCWLLDRKNNNKSYLPSNNGNRDAVVNGSASLSPKHPYVAFTTDRSAIEIWKLESGAEAMKLVKIISLAKSHVHARIKVVWHPTKPIVGWLNDRDVTWYDITTNETRSAGSVSSVQDFIALAEGWLLVGSQRMVKYDDNWNVVSFLTTEQSVENEIIGEFDQCVTSNGQVLAPELNANLRAIQLRGNRIETLTMDEFEKNVSDQ